MFAGFDLELTCQSSTEAEKSKKKTAMKPSYGFSNQFRTASKHNRAGRVDQLIMRTANDHSLYINDHHLSEICRNQLLKTFVLR